jgi:glycosyltransferase involved in cell wall biosynthesis
MFARIHSIEQLAVDHGLQIERIEAGRERSADFFSRWRSIYRRLVAASMVQCVVVSPADFWKFTAPILIAARFLGKPLAVHFALTESGHFVRKIGRLGRSIIRLADTITVSAEASRALLTLYGIRSRHLPPAPDTEEVSPRLITSVQPRLLVVAPPHLPYDISPVLGALDLVKQKYPRAELIVARVRRAGSGQAAVSAIPGVSVVDLDGQESLARLYDEADIYVSSARSDFGGWPMMRAMMAGLPVISCGSAAVEEFVRDQSDGFLLECDDYIDLADRVIQLVENPDLVTRMSRNAARRWQNIDIRRIRRRWQTHFKLLQNC